MDARSHAQPDSFDRVHSQLLHDGVDQEVGGVDEVDAPPPDENLNERPPRHHRRLEGERREVEESSERTVNRTGLQQRLITQLFIHSWLTFFSIWGTLARLGVEWLTSYPNAPVTTPVLWANFGGSLILGFLQEDRALFAGRREKLHLNSASDKESKQKYLQARVKEDSAKKGIPLYIGLAVGFCGSFTSYSSFMRDMFIGLSNDLVGKGQTTEPRYAGWSVASVLGVVVTEISVSVSALTLGAHIAIALLPLLSRVQNMISAKVVNALGVFLGLGGWLGAVLLAIWPPHDVWRGEVIFALVFGPLGTILRYWLSRGLNRKMASFPLGTFSANMLGTAILAMVYDLQRVRLGSDVVGRSVLGCQVLAGVTEGFCGCLTTVSTWVSELKSMRKCHAYLYGFTSVCVGFSLMVVITGTVHWTVGFSMPICRT